MEKRKILTAKVAKKGRKGRKDFDSIKLGHYSALYFVSFVVQTMLN
jgi:hypothetical protein